MNDSQKLDLLLVKFDGMSSDIKILKEDVATLKEDVKKLDLRVSKLEERTAKLEKGYVHLEDGQASLKESCLDTRRQVSEIKLSLENEIWPSIRIIAEGHVDFSRNLQKALKTDNEFEMMKVRMKILENDMSRVKKKVFA